MRKFEFLRPPYPSELGLSEDEAFVLEKSCHPGLKLDLLLKNDDQPDDSVLEIQSALDSLKTRGLINVDLESESQISASTAGRDLINTLLQKNEWVVYFAKYTEPDKSKNILPIIASVENATTLDSEFIPLRFFTPELDSNGLLLGVHLTRIQVHKSLVMRLVDFCEEIPVVHTDDAKKYFEHVLENLSSHQP